MIGGIKHAQISENSVRLAVLLVLAAVGTVVGGTVSRDFSLKAAEYVAALRSDAPLWEICGTSFRGIAGITLICFVLGFSAVAQPAEALLPFFFGMGFGSAAKGLFILCGAAFPAAMLPGAILGALTVSLAAREAMRMSGAVFRRTFLPDEYVPADAALYIKKFLIILIIGAAAAAADGLTALA